MVRLQKNAAVTFTGTHGEDERSRRIAERVYSISKTFSGTRDEDERSRRIAERAYYISKKRNFEAGFEVDDWLEAEAAETAEGLDTFNEQSVA